MATHTGVGEAVDVGDGGGRGSVIGKGKEGKRTRRRLLFETRGPYETYPSMSCRLALFHIGVLGDVKVWSASYGYVPSLTYTRECRSSISIISNGGCAVS